MVAEPWIFVPWPRVESYESYLLEFPKAGEFFGTRFTNPSQGGNPDGKKSLNIVFGDFRIGFQCIQK